MQNIGEGILTIPENWHNNTLNIFTEQGPGVRGLSITANRDRLQPQKNLEEYANVQALKLPRQLNRFEILKTQRITTDGRPARLFEFTWHSGEAGPVHQVLLIVADGDKVLSLAASCPGRMSEDQLLQTTAILCNFRFNPAR
jgi:hypothetical protein